MGGTSLRAHGIGTGPLAGISLYVPGKEFLMIDWNMGQPAGSFESGRKTPVLGVTAPPPALLDVTAGRTGVGQPSTRDALFQSTVSTAISALADIHTETRR